MYGFIVEGFNDELKIKQLIPNTHVVVTRGTRLNNRVRMDINLALKQCHSVYLLTDPDEAGDLLANMVLREYPNLKRIYLDPEQCKCYRNNRLKIGVEHATDSYLFYVLKQIIYGL